MTTNASPTTLTDFLLARIAEDGAEARGLLAEWDQYPPSAYDMTQVGYIDAGSPERVLAECEAKRQVVEMAREAQQRMINGPEFHKDGTFHTVSAWMGTTLRVLAAVYADHPDYREAWRA